jgi:hypothetical protein
MKRRNFIGGLLALAILSRQVQSAPSVKGITDADKTILRQQDAETLAEWSCILNGWGWPKLLPDPEPPTYIPDGRRGQIMRWIKSRVGYEATLWKHNQSVMTREQFDDWTRMSQGEYRAKYPFNSQDFNEDCKKRVAHTHAMYVRHGAKHLQYVEAG